MSNTRLNFLIADDHALFREGIALVLQKLDNIRIDHACNAKEIITRVEQTPVIDVLLLDYNMPGVSCQENVRHICAVAPLTAIIVMSADDSPSTIESCLNVGVNGFIPKAFSSHDMLEAIKLVLSGERYVPDMKLCHSTTAPTHPEITTRQREIWQHIIDGDSNKVIAHHLGLSENTVKQHVSALFRHLGVHSRTQAIRLAQSKF